MANSSRITTGSAPRLLQYSLDKIIKHTDSNYPVMGDRIFEKVGTNGKAFYEVMQMAGMGLASIKGQGDVISFDSVDQDWVRTIPVICYNKAARITMEAIQDNVYESQLPFLGEEIRKSLNVTRDINMANILNRAFNSSYTGPDGQQLCDSDHPLQAGGTSTNVLGTAQDLSEDSLEQMVLLIDGFKNPDGLDSTTSSKLLVVPKELKFEACRILKSKGQTQSANNDVNAIYHRGDIEDYMVWKRLTDTDAWFVTTDLKHNGLILVRHKEVETKSFQEPFTFDTIVAAYERYVTSFVDWRCIAGTAGA